MKSREPFALAAIWENWKVPGSEEWMRTFWIITTNANDLVADIHDRMPGVNDVLLILHGARQAIDARADKGVSLAHVVEQRRSRAAPRAPCGRWLP